ncbi:MAG: glucose 1-dehydrogenase [Chloroflexota bacterium]|nr:MAG: glucose 1-dehydrogenase [Chloroflexota bacterium]
MSIVTFSLSDKVAIVTGGGRGIGREIALGLATAGADIIVTARTTSEIEQVATEIAALGRRSLALKVDVSQHEDVEGMVASTIATFGKIDILVNCAGISPAYVRAELMSEEDWDRIIAVNLKGLFLCCQTAGKVMIEQQHGRIVNVLSIGAHVALPRLVAYCASKGGGDMVTKVLAVEWAKHNIQVNAIAPGYVATDFTAGLRANAKIYSNLMLRSPVGEMAEPSDVVSAAIFLAADSARFISGATIPIDAGWTAW